MSNSKKELIIKLLDTDTLNGWIGLYQYITINVEEFEEITVTFKK